MKKIEKQSKVSIITVCYNSAKTIEQTIQSVIHQTYSDIEYIIIDGGSTDGTLDIIKKYEDKIAFWVSEPDYGIYDAMNKGIRIASGEVIGIINSDDWYAPDAINHVMNYFEAVNAKVIHGDMMLVDQCGVAQGVRKVKTEASWYLTTIYNHPTVFVRSEVYKKYGGFDTNYKIAADYDFTLRLEENNIEFTYLPQVIAYFRLGGISNTKNKWKCVIETRKVLHTRKIKFLKNNQSEFVKRIDEFLDQYRMYVIRKYLKERIIRTEEMDEYAKGFLREKRKQKFIVWGTGFGGSECLQWFCNDLDVIDCLVDNDIAKQGCYMKEFLIKSPSDAILSGVMILIASTDYYKEISLQLETMGLKPKNDFIAFRDFQIQEIRTYTKKYLPIVENAPRHSM